MLVAFEFESISLTATTMIKDNALWVSAPGQGDFELVPLSTDAFTIKECQVTSSNLKWMATNQLVLLQLNQMEHIRRM